MVLPKYAEREISRWYSKLKSLGLTKGIKKELLEAAIAYKVCLDYSLPFSLAEIASHYNVDKHAIVRKYEELKRRFGWGFKQFDWEVLLLKCMDKLNVYDKRVIQIAKKLHIADSRVRCAVALALSGKARIKDIAKVCCVDRSTIYKRLKEVKKGSL